jgi:formylmethanofuran dehydrogenase subunit B
LLGDTAVDALLWVASFGTEPARPPADVPTIVLGGPGVAAPAKGVYIPVATPGIGALGHLFRTDGVVALPLEAVRDDGLPGVPEIARALVQRVKALKNTA